MPLVSVILPVKNEEAFILDAIKSIQNQTFQDWELIIIDDHSVDKTAQIVHQTAKNDPRITLISSPKAGIAHALNTGIKHSNGDYIARMDADDVSLPERLEVQVQYIQSNDVDAVASKVRHVSSGFHSRGMQRFVDWNNQLLSAEMIYANRFIDAPIIHPTLLAKKSSFEKFGYYEFGDYPEDYELWLRWMHQGAKIEKVDEVLLHWKDRENRLTRTDSRYNQNAFFCCKSQYLAMHLKEKVDITHIAIWGAGKLAKRQAKFLQEKQINIDFFIDVDPAKTKSLTMNKEVVHYLELKEFKNIPFIISYTSNGNARKQIRDYLCQMDLTENNDFIIA